MSLTLTRGILKEFAVRSVMGGSIGDVAIGRVEHGIENALDRLAVERHFTFQQSVFDILTTKAVTTFADIDITHGATAILDNDAGIPANAVGAFFEFQGERNWYECTVRTDTSNATIRQAYTNESDAAVATGTAKLLYPLYALPADFSKEIALVDVSNNEPLEYLPYDVAWLSKLERLGAGTPDAFSIVAQRNDPNQWQLLLWPAPSVTKRYQMVYYRMGGWFDTATPATSTWARVAPAGSTGDAYYVDWPDKLRFVLEALVLAEVAKEIAPSKAQQYEMGFIQALMRASNFDQKVTYPLTLSQGGPRRRGTRYEF